MIGFNAALWTESLKMRRSKVPLLTALGFSLAPLVGGLFMIILKDPARAREMGLLGAKAQLTVGVADWPAYFGILAQAVAVGGALLFAVLTIWVFGREFIDHTAKELMALPTARSAIVAAKFVVVLLLGLGLTLYIFGLGLLVATLVDIPGWSLQLVGEAFIGVMGAAMLTLALMPFVALLASIGRGYLPPVGWTFLTLFLANIVAYTGWGDWFPWTVPALFSGAAGPRAEQLGLHSYLLVLVAMGIGATGTFLWWQRADQMR
ncbi:MAG TPA: ABC transporter permease [Caldilineaceae bacterium]|nr:ABC transporter permease [Caldilineaceae bacterium]